MVPPALPALTVAWCTRVTGWPMYGSYWPALHGTPTYRTYLKVLRTINRADKVMGMVDIILDTEPSVRHTVTHSLVTHPTRNR